MLRQHASPSVRPRHQGNSSQSLRALSSSAPSLTVAFALDRFRASVAPAVPPPRHRASTPLCRTWRWHRTLYAGWQNDDSTLPDLSWWDAYHPYAEHGDFFDDLHASFPNNSELFVAGKSYEGRDIYGIHFWGKDGKDANPAVSWHSTVHAREWVSALTTEYLAYKLISGYLEGDKGTQALVDKFDYYVIPFVNPDGFVFTQTSTRLWRKNRQPRANTTCVGTDGNRNWPFGWHYPGGASDNPCGETYRGLAAADTPEIASLVAWTETVKAKHGVKLFIDFHSYGQYALQPYGYDCSVVPPNFERQVHVAKCYADAVFAVNGSKYVYGSSCRELYATTGSAPDFHSGAVEAEFAWTIELRPASAGAGGFVLPPEQIRPNVEEQWAGLHCAECLRKLSWCSCPTRVDGDANETALDIPPEISAA
ncbi:zinc carboxypeptidase A 1 [Verticillium alfalfae VaMs.102]|uniref:Zinc carboxypeptidase A 1 n=1 Tax=Verticillium alfalfae (strain VaMs.102 / ATCC MYA-4576 / FGSC 10136) TaxID=526221 RepID=C9S5U5_VERA1|nr:zinc carboxypeptidase A 1 [Verticillium alfalfae VaMs.102]EEY15084.1 zinc carboxypeptidase A 1 [Verticillium alfalfae VaMs.102]